MPIRISGGGNVDTSALDARYVLVSGDTMTGALVVDTQSSFYPSLISRKDMRVAVNKKIIFAATTTG